MLALSRDLPAAVREIAEQMNWEVPDWCVLPVCYGDALLGMWRGFEDMIAFGWTTRMPRMVAAEVHGSLGAALADGSDLPPDMRPNQASIAVSIGATRSTFQALDVVRRSGGAAVTIGNAELRRWQRSLADEEGLFVETSSAAAVAAAEQLRSGGRNLERLAVSAARARHRSHRATRPETRSCRPRSARAARILHHV
jgi:threonine synthase